jgi:hypothetical protein
MLFNLSLHRSATTSISHLLRDLDFSCLDWVGWGFERRFNHLFYKDKQRELLSHLLKRFPDFTYYGDLPIPLLHECLLEKFPNASYFIVLRDVDDWAESSIGHCLHVGNHANNPLDDVLTPSHRMMLDKYGLLEESRKHLANKEMNSLFKIWRRLYYAHLKRICENFADCQASFKIFYLSDPGLAAKLCNFACPELSASQCESFKLRHLHDRDRGRS